MNVSDDKKFETLFQHYNDTFQYVQGYSHVREKLFLFALIIILIMSFDITSTADSTKIISEIIEKKIGLQIVIKTAFIGSILWFSLLSIVIRYFQINILIKRQYSYIHKLEDKLCTLGGEIFHREGKAYFENYPLFAKWTWFLYTIIFPIFLIFVTILRVHGEYIARKNLGISYYVDIVLFGIILISNLLYLFQIHLEK